MSESILDGLSMDISLVGVSLMLPVLHDSSKEEGMEVLRSIAVHPWYDGVLLTALNGRELSLYHDPEGYVDRFRAFIPLDTFSKTELKAKGALDRLVFCDGWVAVNRKGLNLGRRFLLEPEHFMIEPYPSMHNLLRRYTDGAGFSVADTRLPGCSLYMLAKVARLLAPYTSASVGFTVSSSGKDGPALVRWPDVLGGRFMQLVMPLRVNCREDDQEPEPFSGEEPCIKEGLPDWLCLDALESFDRERGAIKDKPEATEPEPEEEAA